MRHGSMSADRREEHLLNCYAGGRVWRRQTFVWRQIPLVLEDGRQACQGACRENELSSDRRPDLWHRKVSAQIAMVAGRSVERRRLTDFEAAVGKGQAEPLAAFSHVAETIRRSGRSRRLRLGAWYLLIVVTVQGEIFLLDRHGRSCRRCRRSLDIRPEGEEARLILEDTALYARSLDERDRWSAREAGLCSFWKKESRHLSIACRQHLLNKRAPRRISHKEGRRAVASLRDDVRIRHAGGNKAGPVWGRYRLARAAICRGR